MASSPKPQPNLDGLGIFWIIWALVWTIIVACGMTFLWRRRDMPMLRIRDLPLSFAAIIMLHLYWGAIQTGYVYFPLFTPEGEFWIMSIYFPIGIALFHASNSRFLHVANQQKELFASDEKAYSKSRVRPGSLLGRFRALDYTKKILVTIGLGMVVQVCDTFYNIAISHGRPLTLTDDTHNHHVVRFQEVPSQLGCGRY